MCTGARFSRPPGCPGLRARPPGAMRGKELPQAAAAAATRPVPANKPFRTDRGPEAGGRGMPSPFINLDERGRHTPPPSLLPLVPMRKGLLEEVLPVAAAAAAAAVHGTLLAC